MDLTNIDKKVTIKCYKEKRGMRTFVIGLYDFFDSIQECNNFCKTLQKILATSMKIVQNKSITCKKENNEIVDGELQEKEKDKEKEDKEDKEKDKKDKKNKKKKKELIIENPIYTYRGNQIDKIKKYILDNTTINNSYIYT